MKTESLNDEYKLFVKTREYNPPVIRTLLYDPYTDPGLSFRGLRPGLNKIPLILLP